MISTPSTWSITIVKRKRARESTALLGAIVFLFFATIELCAYVAHLGPVLASIISSLLFGVSTFGKFQRSCIMK